MECNTFVIKGEQIHKKIEKMLLDIFRRVISLLYVMNLIHPPDLIKPYCRPTLHCI